jgi:hypothetical protein
MPRARIFDGQGGAANRTALVVISLLATLGGDAWAQSPFLQDVVDSTKQSKLTEQTKSLLDALRPGPAVESSVPKNGPGKPPEIAAPLTPPAAPVLRAIYGINQTLEAEIVLDGHSYSIFSDDERIEIGPWNHGRVMPDSVLLLRAPLTVKQIDVVEQLRQLGMERRISCQRLGLKNVNCLFLTANKASSGVVPTPVINSARGSSSATPLPPLPR